MRVGRTIFAVVVAVSVAMLPIAGHAAPDLNAGDISVSQTPCDCCDARSSQCDMMQNAMLHCCATAACTGVCFGFPVSSFSNFYFSPISAKRSRPAPSDALSSQMGSPPFRPPRG